MNLKIYRGLDLMSWDDVQAEIGTAITKNEVIEAAAILETKSPGSPGEAVGYAIFEVVLREHMKRRFVARRFDGQILADEMQEQARLALTEISAKLEPFFQDKTLSAAVDPEGHITDVEVWRRRLI